MPTRKMLRGDADKLCCFYACQRFNLPLGFIAAPKIASHPECRVGRELLILDGLRQHRAQRAGNNL
jgi:hypothetical protein